MTVTSALDYLEEIFTIFKKENHTKSGIKLIKTFVSRFEKKYGYETKKTWEVNESVIAILEKNH